MKTPISATEHPARPGPRPFALALCFVLALGTGCTSDADAPSDAGPVDAGAVDAGNSPDGGSGPDAGLHDGGSPDAGPICDCEPHEVCNVAMQCVVPPVPLGGFCGPTDDCPLASPDFHSCANQQCASNQCAPATLGAALDRDVCIRACEIYQDDDADGVNDIDAPLDDCNPVDVVDGPAGSVYRCANHSSPVETPLGHCVPGLHLNECLSNADCGANEACTLSTIGGAPNLRCFAIYRENARWGGTVVRLGEACNEDPAAGPLAYCEDGPCLEDGTCSAFCQSDPHCDTTLLDASQRCVGSFCTNEPARGCSVDIDCATLHCAGVLDVGGGATFTHCAARP